MQKSHQSTFFAVRVGDQPSALTLACDGRRRLVVEMALPAGRAAVTLDARAARRLANAVLGEFGRGGVALEVL